MRLNGEVGNTPALERFSLGLRPKRLVAVEHARLSVVVVLALGLVPPPQHPTTSRPRPHPRFALRACARFPPDQQHHRYRLHLLLPPPGRQRPPWPTRRRRRTRGRKVVDLWQVPWLNLLRRLFPRVVDLWQVPWLNLLRLLFPMVPTAAAASSFQPLLFLPRPRRPAGTSRRPLRRLPPRPLLARAPRP